MLFHLCGLDAGSEQLDEFGAVVAKGGEGLVGFDKFGIAQEFKPVLRLPYGREDICTVERCARQMP